MLLWHWNCENDLSLVAAKVAANLALAIVLSKFVVSWPHQAVQQTNLPQKKMTDTPSLLLLIKQEMEALSLALSLCSMLSQLFGIQHPAIMLCTQSLEEKESECPHLIPSFLCLREGISNTGKAEWKAEAPKRLYDQLDPQTIKDFFSNRVA